MTLYFPAFSRSEPASSHAYKNSRYEAQRGMCRGVHSLGERLGRDGKRKGECPSIPIAPLEMILT